MSNECQNPCLSGRQANIKDAISCRLNFKLHIYLNFELWHLTFMLNIQRIECIDSQKDNDYDIGKVLSSI